jgi:hypothetical protein
MDKIKEKEKISKTFKSECTKVVTNLITKVEGGSKLPTNIKTLLESTTKTKCEIVTEIAKEIKYVAEGQLIDGDINESAENKNALLIEGFKEFFK